MSTKHTIITGDSRAMDDVVDKSIQLIITSPPYWQLKDYGTDTQIGFNDSYEDYINHLNLVWAECYRVIENGCRLCINIGDQFARSVYYGRYKVIPIRTEIIKFCESIGFDYMGAIIWQKKTTTNTTGGASIMGSFPLPRNGVVSIDYEFILLFKKLGTAKPVDKLCKEASKLTTNEWKEYFSGHWNFTGARQSKHIAVFPEELPKRLIKMFSFVGDTVLDPFMGSGTTALVAKKLNRHSVGYEINSDFVAFIKEKLAVQQQDLLPAEYRFQTQQKLSINFRQRIKKMPYVFTDFHKIDKKVDPTKLSFGSVIHHGQLQKDRQEYFVVSEIISPELIRLNNGLVIRLIGIRADESIQTKAIDYLRHKIAKQKVFIKYDAQKYDRNDNLLCYLYLKNKTFINAHLIRDGLAKVDISYVYKHSKKFLTLQGQNNG